MTARRHHLSWSHGTFEVLDTAGMLARVEFDLGDRRFAPFAQADWMGTLSDANLPGHLRELGGEFVGLPFGSSGPPEGMTNAWKRAVGDSRNKSDHGLSADADWEIISCTGGKVHMRLAYPGSSPILCLDRYISGREGGPALDFRLDVTARCNTSVSMGLHPIFRLPDNPGRLAIEADFEQGWTYPGLIPPARMVTAPNRHFRSLSHVPGAGEAVNLGRLPLGQPLEDNVLLAKSRGPVILTYLDDAAEVSLDWDRSILPSVMLWMSDRGAVAEPFLGRYRGLGVEPIAAAFDLADAVSVGRNPLNATGVPTSVGVSAHETLSVEYSIAVRAL